METQAEEYQMKLLYTLNERPPHGLTFLLALQHMLASIGGIVAVPLIVGVLPSYLTHRLTDQCEIAGIRYCDRCTMSWLWPCRHSDHVL